MRREGDAILKAYLNLYMEGEEEESLSKIAESESQYFNESEMGGRKVEKEGGNIWLKVCSFLILLLIIWYLGIKGTDYLVPYNRDSLFYGNFKLPNINEFEG